MRQIFHSLIARSFDPVASQLPSKEKLQHVTYLRRQLDQHNATSNDKLQWRGVGVGGGKPGVFDRSFDPHDQA